MIAKIFDLYEDGDYELEAKVEPCCFIPTGATFFGTAKISSKYDCNKKEILAKLSSSLLNINGNKSIAFQEYDKNNTFTTMSDSGTSLVGKICKNNFICFNGYVSYLGEIIVGKIIITKNNNKLTEKYYYKANNKYTLFTTRIYIKL